MATIGTRDWNKGLTYGTPEYSAAWDTWQTENAKKREADNYVLTTDGTKIPTNTPEFSSWAKTVDRPTIKAAMLAGTLDVRERDGWTTYDPYNTGGRGRAIDPYGWAYISPYTQAEFQRAYESGTPLNTFGKDSKLGNLGKMVANGPYTGEQRNWDLSPQAGIRPVGDFPYTELIDSIMNKIGG